MYRFVREDTRELLATMPQGSYKEAKEERDRLSEECGCVVIIIED